MSLDVSKLENVRELEGGIVQARCPACAEGGHDHAGQHLRVYADGRFGCCVHPKDREHRRRIFALAGDRSARQFTVRIGGAKSSGPEARSVASSLTEMLRTVRTAKCELDSSDSKASQVSPDPGPSQPYLQSEYFRTLRTTFPNPRAYARKEEYKEHVTCDVTYTYKGWEKGVLPVLSGSGPVQAESGRVGEVLPPKIASGVTRPVMPYLTADGTLVIPFDSPERYHWWKVGQSVAETRRECGLMIADRGMERREENTERGNQDAAAV